MAETKLNARDFLAQVQDTDGAAWLDIAGVASASLNPSQNEETADTTTFASGGAYEQEVMQRGATIKLEGFLFVDEATGAQSPGQARCEDLAAAVGVASVGVLRFRYPADAVWRVWNCTATLGEQGGDNNDKVSWSVTFTRSGPTTTTAVA